MKYKITDIRQRSREAAGKRELFIKIHYEAETGYKGTIEIDKDKFSEKEARKQIEHELKEMMKLGVEKEVKG